MSPRICLLRGDGVGEELLPHVRAVLSAASPTLDFVEAELGFGAFERHGTALPDTTLAAARDADACLLVAVGSPSEPTPGYASPIVALRRELDLFANLRPVRSLPSTCPAADSQRPEVDLLIVRENTEGLYAGRERREGDVAVAERVISGFASRRITRVAGELAAARRGRVCVVHKANVLRATCGLFREVALGVLAEQPELEVEEMLVDHAAYRLAAEPERFDVIVTTNLFGDVLSDLAAHAGGGLGLACSSNLGEAHALFEPVHGSAPDIAGRDIANPVASLRAGAALLAHQGLSDAAQRLTDALDDCLARGPWTADLGGDASTGAVTDAVLRRLAASGSSADAAHNLTSRPSASAPVLQHPPTEREA
ncbi:MAG: NAD-dependent isocitrate dehydrogenase [Planctomycetota bacterium]|nr:MAG: NAD-dependent isocitrate dehydrogenase [Planctomycetota bacterium]